MPPWRRGLGAVVHQNQLEPVLGPDWVREALTKQGCDFCQKITGVPSSTPGWAGQASLRTEADGRIPRGLLSQLARWAPRTSRMAGRWR